MAVKIRLQRKGRRKKPYYHIVVADARAPRDGKFIEKIGSYNPMTSPATIEIDSDRALDWLLNGAQPTDTARAILRFTGVLYRKHLNRGVKKGAFSQEIADQMYVDFMKEKNDRVALRAESSKQAELVRMSAISGAAKVLEIEEVAEEVVEVIAEANEQSSSEAIDVVEAVAEVTEEAVAEATEEAVAEVTEEAVAEPVVVDEEVEEAVDEVGEVAEEASEAAKDEAEKATEKTPE